MATKRQIEVLKNEFGIQIDSTISEKDAAGLINQAYAARRRGEERQETIKSRKYRDILFEAFTEERDISVKTFNWSR